MNRQSVGGYPEPSKPGMG